MNRFFCAMAARERDEPVFATASRVDRWLLVEAPGAWGPRALPQSRRLDDEVLLPLQQKARRLHARTLLIRRPGRTEQLERRWVFAADSRPGHETLLARQVTDTELVDLRLPFDGPTDGWEPATTLVGVCTHGRHDACCATHGRAVAVAIAGAHPEMTWEVSHLGGDRFAANAIVLPGGHYLGRLPAVTAASVMDRMLQGERPDPYYRGRSCWSPVAQAALTFAALDLGETGLDALQPGHVTSLDGGRWRVHVHRRAPEAPALVVEVEQRHGPESDLLTCRAASEQPVPSWHLVGIETEAVEPSTP